MRHPTEPPDLRPRRTLPILVLAWIAYHSNRRGKTEGKAEHEASYLHLQQSFRLTTAEAAGRVLATLRRPGGPGLGPWIVVTKKSKYPVGNCYGLGPAAAANVEQWIALGKALFGPTGAMTPFMSRPILLNPKHGFAPNGCLTLGYIEKYGPVSNSEAVGLLRHFMDPKTVRTKIRRLVAHDLVLEEDGELFTPRNLRERIRRDELAYGAVARTREIDEAIAQQQYQYQLRRLGGPLLVRVKSMLRKSDCFYCRAVPPPEGGDVEHFPPKHWGGSDELSLLLPSCRSCNGSLGAIVRRTDKVPTPMLTLDRVEFAGTVAEAAEMFLKAMMTMAAKCADDLNEGRIDEARSAALDIFPMWIALKSGVQFVDTTSGEVGTLQIGHDMEMIPSISVDIGGIPHLLGGTKKRRRQAVGRR